MVGVFKAEAQVIKATRHGIRLLTAFRKLAAYDGLFALRAAEAEIPLLGLARRLFCLGVTKVDEIHNLRPGQRLALALPAMGPAFIKLGQTLSTRPDILGKQVAADLAGLQDRLEPFSFSEVKKALAVAFDQDADKLFSSFDENAVAAASIAQVHFATTAEGDEVAVKVLRPGIEQQFARDLESFDWAAGLLERWVSLSRRLKPREIVGLMAKTVTVEMDMRMEAAAASELAENMRAETGYRVPNVYWQYTSKRVLTLERVKGIPIYDRAAIIKAGQEPSQLASTVVRLFLTQSIRDGFFHADLHPGNLFVAADGAVLPVDFGIMGRLDLPTRRFLAEILWGFHKGDYERVAEVHFEAGYVPADQSLALFAQGLRAMLEPIKGRPINEISFGRLLARLLETTATFSMETQPQLLVLQRAMVMSEGLALQLDPEANMWELSRPVLERLIREVHNPLPDLLEISKRLRRVVRRLPELLERLEAILTTPEKPG
jgi:ubiquinone biosynthesis protein